VVGGGRAQDADAGMLHRAVKAGGRQRGRAVEIAVQIVYMCIWRMVPGDSCCKG
jgi:hypothetical protein